MTDRTCYEYGRGGTCNHEQHEHCPNENIKPCENQCDLCKEEAINKEVTPMTDKMTIEQAIALFKCMATDLVGFAATEQDEKVSQMLFDKVKAMDMAIEALEKQEWHKYADEKPKEEGEYLCCDFILPNTPKFSVCSWSNNLYKVDKFDFEDGKDQSGFYEYCSEWGHYQTSCVYWKPIDWEGDTE